MDIINISDEFSKANSSIKSDLTPHSYYVKSPLNKNDIIRNHCHRPSLSIP